MRVLEVDLLRALDSSASRPVKSAVAAALAGAGSLRSDDSERSSNLPLPPPPESASISMRAPMPAEASSSGLRRASTSGEGRSQVIPVPVRELSAVVPVPVAAPEPVQPARRSRETEEDLAPPPSSNTWLWLVAAGTVVAVAVLLGPQLFGKSPATPGGDSVASRRTGAGSAEAGSADAGVVADADAPPDPEPARVVVPVTKDPAVVVSRAQLALDAGRWTEPLGDNLAEHLKQLAELEPANESIAGLRRKAAEQLLPKAAKELADKHASEAAAILRQLLAIWPDNKDAIGPYTEAVISAGRLQRHLKLWDELLPFAEDLARVNPKSFDGHMLRGQALAGLGRWTDAEAAFKMATELRPKDKGAKEALAEAKKKVTGK